MSHSSRCPLFQYFQGGKCHLTHEFWCDGWIGRCAFNQGSCEACEEDGKDCSERSAARLWVYQRDSTDEDIPSMTSVSSRKRWTRSPSDPRPDLIASRTAVAPLAHVSPQSPSPTICHISITAITPQTNSLRHTVSHSVNFGSSAITSSEAILIDS